MIKSVYPLLLLLSCCLVPCGVPQAPAKTEQAPAAVIVHPGDGAVMVYIPPGPFTMGNNTGWPEERPEHIVDLPGYYIDKYEVTIDMFRRFAESAAFTDPDYWMEGDVRKQLAAGEYVRTDWREYDALSPTTAMFHVRFAEADAYCRWAGKHLPTAQQWEKAARGSDGRRYPWGNDWLPNVSWSLSPDEFKAGIDRTADFPVDVHFFPEGDSPYGVRQMSGNVWEWCRSAMLPYPGNVEPYKFYAVFWGVFMAEVRGGGWTVDPRFTTVTFRTFGDTGIRNKTYGFRCACDANIR